MHTDLATRPSATPCGVSKDFDFDGSDGCAELPQRIVQDPVMDVIAPVEDPTPLAEAPYEGPSLLELAMGLPTA